MATKTTRKVESGVLASVHEIVADLHGIGLLDKATMLKFDALCLTRIEPLPGHDRRSGRSTR